MQERVLQQEARYERCKKDSSAAVKRIEIVWQANVMLASLNASRRNQCFLMQVGEKRMLRHGESGESSIDDIVRSYLQISRHAIWVGL